MNISMTCIAIQGETNQAIAQALYGNDAPCMVSALFKGADDNRLEATFSDWTIASTLSEGALVTITLTI